MPGPVKRHRAALARVVGDRGQRGGVEADDLVVVQPGDELVLLRLERRRVVVAQHVAGVLRRRGRRR